MKKQILNILLLLISTASFGQMAMSYHISNNKKIGFDYEFSPKIWGDLRIYTETFVEDLTGEALVAYNYKKAENYDCYLGAGLTLNQINAISLPIGIRFRPFDDKNLLFNIEAEPIYIIDEPEGALSFFGSVGIKYILGKKE